MQHIHPSLPGSLHPRHWLSAVLLSLGLRSAAVEASVQNIPDQGLSLKHWALLGPFPSTPMESVSEEDPVRKSFRRDYLKSLGGEAKFQFQNGDEFRIEGKSYKTFQVEAWDWGFHDIPAFNQGVGYASTRISLKQDQELYLYFMSHGSPQVWVNGQKVLESYELRHHARKMQYGVKLRLNEGENRFLVKLDNFRGWAGFQLELIPVEHHEAQVLKRLKKLKLESVSRDAQGGAQVRIQHEPPALDVQVPVRVELKDETGSLLASAEGRSDQPLHLPVSPELEEVVYLEVSASPDFPYKLKGERKAYYPQDIQARCAELRAWFIEAAPRLQQSSPRMQAALDWIEFWLGDVSRQDPFDPSDVANLLYVEDLKKALAQGKNLFLEEQGTAFPCLFRAQLPDGKEIVGEYHITLPQAYLEANEDQREQLRLPLLYNLHGAGGTGQKIKAYRNETKDRHFDEVDHRGNSFLKILPRATYTYRWHPDWLNALDAHLEAQWQIAPQQVHLQGFSMGGWGTFVWGASRPERFATLTPMGMAGDRIFSNIGKEKALQALQGKKLWYIMGQHDQLFPASLVLYQELQEAGVDLRYSVYGSKGHGGLERMAKEEGLTQWQLRNPLRSSP